MQRESVNRFTVFGKAAIAGLLIAWVLTAAILSSGHLHELVHHDSRHATHECAISLFERGQALTGEPVCELVLRVDARAETALVSQGEYFSSFRALINGTRGPPV